ncbi:hypothetical protein ACIBF6_37295 [Streptosporangium amethystogenes]|uniref:hypothetical protein n=1 Tax=Streptosporangium amethystogenes TaxID=2002 RepID=UPI00379E6579
MTVAPSNDSFCRISASALRPTPQPKERATEAAWEKLALEELAQLGWEPLAGKDISPGSEKRKT